MSVRIHHSSAGQAHHHVPKFEAAKHSTAKLNAVSGPVKQWRASMAVANDLKQATTENWVLYGSTFRVDKGELQGVLADPAKLNDFGYSLIFRADGSAAGGSTGNGWGGLGSPGPDMSMTPVSKGSELFSKVLDTVNAQFQPYAPEGQPPPAQTPEQKAQQKKVDAGARAALESMLHEPHTRLYWAHWDNSDDTTLDGAIAINEKTGDVRVIGLWQPA